MGNHSSAPLQSTVLGTAEWCSGRRAQEEDWVRYGRNRLFFVWPTKAKSLWGGKASWKSCWKWRTRCDWAFRSFPAQAGILQAKNAPSSSPYYYWWKLNVAQYTSLVTTQTLLKINTDLLQRSQEYSCPYTIQSAYTIEDTSKLFIPSPSNQIHWIIHGRSTIRSVSDTQVRSLQSQGYNITLYIPIRRG